MNWSQNSVVYKFGEEGADGPKSQKMFVFESIDRQSKIVQYIQKLAL